MASFINRSVFVVIVLVCVTCEAQTEFARASFFGVSVGRSTIADFKKRFGEPDNSYENRLSGRTWMLYTDIGPVAGKVEVDAESATGVIAGISVEPNDRLRVDDAMRLFGSDFRRIRYAFEPCLGDDTRPLYESDRGFPYIVYPKLGIALVIDSQDERWVKFIHYLAEPVGTKESRCKDGNFR